MSDDPRPEGQSEQPPVSEAPAVAEQPVPAGAAADGKPSDRPFHARWVKRYLTRSVVVVFPMMLFALVWLLTSVAVFAVLMPSGGLFVFSVETTRLDFDASEQERGEIWLDGVLIRAEEKQVVDAAAHPGAPGKVIDPAPTVGSHRDYFCYTGAVMPGDGTRVEIAMLNGRQIMQISSPRKPSDSPALVPRPTTLSFNGQELALTAAHAVRPGTRQGSAADVLFDFGSDEGDVAADDESGLDFGAFELQGPVVITADPACEEAASERQGFAILDPITIDGPAILGRKLHPQAGARIVDTDIPHLQGSVEVIISQVLCWERLLSFIQMWSSHEKISCKRIYRIEAEPMTLPPGSSLLSVVSDPPPSGQGDRVPGLDGYSARVFGQVYFREGRYMVNASTEADQFIILRPGTQDDLEDGNVLSVPFMDRLVLEPLLVIFASAFFALSGLLLGILQVEDED